MLEPHTGSLLVDYYETYLRDHDIDAFREHVSARYLEGTLARLIESPGLQSRRASVFALGLFGSFEVNAAVARALTRQRPDRPEPRRERPLGDLVPGRYARRITRRLEKVARLIGQQRFEDAVALADQAHRPAPRASPRRTTSGRSPSSSWADFQESADDCRLVLERNPYHFGALSGLAKCQVRLGQREPAIETLRRVSKLQPFNQAVRDWIASLEAGDL